MLRLALPARILTNATPGARRTNTHEYYAWRPPHKYLRMLRLTPAARILTNATPGARRMNAATHGAHRMYARPPRGDDITPPSHVQEHCGNRTRENKDKLASEQ